MSLLLLFQGAAVPPETTPSTGRPIIFTEPWITPEVRSTRIRSVIPVASSVSASRRAPVRLVSRVTVASTVSSRASRRFDLRTSIPVRSTLDAHRRPSDDLLVLDLLGVDV